MEPLYLKACRMCMCYRHLKPLDSEMVRKIGSCFGIMINLEDRTLPLGICRKCTKKVIQAKKYRDFYLSVQTKLFVKRSNHFLRIDRQPLVEVILRRNESPRYIYPSGRRVQDRMREEKRTKARPSSESKTDPQNNASGNINASVNRLLSPSTSSAIATSHCRPEVESTAVPRQRTTSTDEVPNQSYSPSPVLNFSNSNTPPPAAITLVVTTPEEVTMNGLDDPAVKEDFEATEHDNNSEKESFPIEKLETESDIQSQDDTENVDDSATFYEEQKIYATEELEEVLQDQNMEDPEEHVEAEYLNQHELSAGDGLDSEHHLTQEQYDSTEIEVLEASETIESVIPGNENTGYNVQDTRRRRRSKISGRELYKSLLTECNICGKMIERNRLEGHINRHSGRRPYACHIEGCSSRFHCKHACRLHVRCRHGSESFTCTECGKVYKARRDLLGHIRETHVEPRFQCDVCGKKFTTRSRLKQHSFYHTGERNYPCRVCEMRFFSNFQLKVHMRTHTKSFPYKCSVCNKRFRYRHMAKEHIVKDHGIDISLQKDWVIQYPEPDPEEVEVINEEENIIQYNIQRLEETEDEDNTLGEGADSATVSLKIDNTDEYQIPTSMNSSERTANKEAGMMR
ncbi:transcription factor E4F1-like [Anopheles merus]|uniref:transcription factor E4F1-like n=1 Tax=Anopheles merus TaxID=30066 RepID=UPI001BE4B4CA|nr:transcription factor E4F1-like [Anopheles merus]